MAYTFDPIFAADPSNPDNVAANGVVTIYAPGDSTRTPLTLTTVAGLPLANPVTVSENGFSEAFRHETLDRVAWEAGGFTGYLTSYEGLKSEAVSARQAAEAAKDNAATAAEAELSSRIAAGEFKGEPGRDGSNVVPTAEAIATAIAPGGSAYPELSATIAGEVDPVAQSVIDKSTGTGVFIPSGNAASRWRTIRDNTLAGLRQAHISVIGDSIAFGAAGSGTTPPKNRSSWPGRLRTIVNTERGPAGTGIVYANPAILATNPEWDPRWAFVGNVVNFTFGIHRAGDYRLQEPVSGSTYIEFTSTCTEFVIYSLAGGGNSGFASVDGGAEKTFKNKSGTDATVALPPVYPTGNPVVTVVPAGALGQHTLRIRRDAAAGTSHDLHIIGVEARTTTAGRFRVTNFGYSSKSLESGGFGSVNNDETNALWGLPIMLDMVDADLLVLALGINDWQSGRTIETLKTALVNGITRQRASGNNTQAHPKPEGDAVLLWNPKPDIVGLAKDPALWDAYRDMFYTVATEQDCVLIDLGGAWGEYAQANAADLYADTIHPNNLGSYDIAKRVHAALFHEVY